MPRTAKHPLKLSKGEHVIQASQEVSICTVVHIPTMAGYWGESLDVLKIFFQTLYANTNQPFDLLVFDNASCSEVQEYLVSLHRAGKIQYLTLSTYNLKKLGAMDYLFARAPGEYVVFADSDVYFLPGWLEESLAVLRVFPEAGQVSALPTIDKRNHFVTSTLRGISLAENISLHRGNLVPEPYIYAHQLSIGREKAEYMQNAGVGEDIRITRQGINAYVSAQDFQFTTRKEVIRQVLPLEVRNEREFYDSIYSPVFEIKADECGWWRLSTSRYLVHHMGNRVPDLTYELDGVAADLPILRSPNKIRSGRGKPAWQRRITETRLVRNFLKYIYTRAYDLLFEKR